MHAIHFFTIALIEQQHLLCGAPRIGFRRLYVCVYVHTGGIITRLQIGALLLYQAITRSRARATRNYISHIFIKAAATIYIS